MKRFYSHAAPTHPAAPTRHPALSSLILCLVSALSSFETPDDVCTVHHTLTSQAALSTEWGTGRGKGQSSNTAMRLTIRIRHRRARVGDCGDIYA
jgi:hypothetical protein